jgi:hypothetical protein
MKFFLYLVSFLGVLGFWLSCDTNSVPPALIKKVQEDGVRAESLIGQYEALKSKFHVLHEESKGFAVDDKGGDVLSQIADYDEKVSAYRASLSLISEEAKGFDKRVQAGELNRASATEYFERTNAEVNRVQVTIIEFDKEFSRLKAMWDTMPKTNALNNTKK